MTVKLLEAVAEDAAIGDYFDMISSGEGHAPCPPDVLIKDSMKLAKTQLKHRWRARKLERYMHAALAPRGEAPRPPLGAVIGAASAAAVGVPPVASAAAAAAVQSLTAARAAAASGAAAGRAGGVYPTLPK